MNKTIKRNVVISAILAIMLCVSLIAGATFALFTSESKVNIAVTSGKVDVVATVENEQLSSTLGKNVAETSVTYNADKNTITLDKIVPGDVVSFDIRVHNNSNVAVKYRTIIMCEKDNGLFSGLKVSIGKEEYKGRTSISEYADLAVDAEDQIIPVVITLPEEAGNQYQDKTCVISYKVEAVQGNANIEPTPKNIFEVYNAFDWMSFVEQADNGTLDSAIDTVKFINNIDLDGIEYGAYALTISGNTTFTIDGNDCTINNLNTTASRVPGTGDSFYGAGLFAKVAGVWGEYNHKLLIKDLTVNNAIVAPEHSNLYSAAAVLVGETYALNEIEFNNCSVVNSSVTSGAYAGAFIGYDYAFSLINQKITVIGGSVKGSTFSGNDATAALIAINYAPAEISNVEISGNTVNGGDGYSAAALVGTAFGSFSATNVTLANNTFTMNEGNTNYKGDHKEVGYFYCSGLYEVNGVPYTTSLEQFSNAVNGTYETVVLAADITNEILPQNAVGQPLYTYTLESNRVLTIDFNGHILTSAVRLFEIKKDATLTLISSEENGKIVINKRTDSTTNTSDYGIYVNTDATLNIGTTDGKNGIILDVHARAQNIDAYCAISNQGLTNLYAGEIIVWDSAAISMQTGAAVFNMNGGKITLKSEQENGASTAVALLSATANLNSGTVEGKGKVYNIVLNMGTVNVNQNFTYSTTNGLN